MGAEGSTVPLPNFAHRNLTHSSTALKKARNVWHGQGAKLIVSFTTQRGSKLLGPAFLQKPTIPSHRELPDPPCFPQPCPAAPGRTAEAHIRFQGLAKTSRVTLSPSAHSERGSSSQTGSSPDLSAGHFIAPLSSTFCHTIPLATNSLEAPN